jgi:hypothetical protein
MPDGMAAEDGKDGNRSVHGDAQSTPVNAGVTGEAHRINEMAGALRRGK